MKKAISLLLIVSMLTSMLGLSVFAAGTDTTLFLQASDFANHLGTWQILDDTAKDAEIDILVGTADENPSGTAAAAAAIEIPQDGSYSVLAMTRDFTSAPGNRFCNIQVGDTMLEKKIGNTGKDYWTWETIGTVDLKKGETIIRLHDTGAYWARVQGIILTTDKSLKPANLKKLASENAAKVLNVKIPDTTTGGNSAENAVNLKSDKTYITLAPESFENHLGSWTITSPNDAGGYVVTYLKGEGGYQENPNFASRKIVIPKDGYYKIHTLSREYDSYIGQRFFDIQIGNYPKTRLGVHGVNGWAWETSDSMPMYAGEYDLKLTDASGCFARLAMIVVTDDEELSFTNNVNEYTFMLKNLYKDGLYKAEAKSDKPDADRPATEIAVKLNGKYMNFDVDPVLMNDRTMVPFRAIFEALGCTVSWNDDAQIAKGIRNGKIIRLPIGSKTANVSGSSVTLDQPAVVKDDRTLVPLRFVAEALGAAVDWNDATQTVTIMAAIPEAVYWLRPSSFATLGTWSQNNMTDGAFESSALLGTAPSVPDAKPSDGDPSKTEPAVATFSVAEGGEYYLWIRARDYSENQPGSRFFNVSVNGKTINQKFGTHSANGFKWVRADEKVALTAGENTLSLLDTSGFYARCDSVLLCKNDTFVPPESLTVLQAIASPLPLNNDDFIDFPIYANEQNAPTESAAIENNQTKVVFYKVPTSKGQVIQNEIYTRDASGNWFRTKTRDEDLGFFVANADTVTYKDGIASMRIYGTELAAYNTTYTKNGRTYSYNGTNPYLAGFGEWFIPTDYTQDGNTITLYFADGERANVSATYSLDESSAPLVSATMTAKQDGYFTLAGWEGGKFTYEEFSDAVAPYRVLKKRINPEIATIVEQYLFTPMGCYTATENNKYGQVPVTKGVVADPDWIPQRWVHTENSYFGMNMKTPDDNYRGTLFSPILGHDESKLSQNQTFTMNYRVISSISDWYTNFKFVSQDLFNVHDYRENTYATLNEAIFNTRKLMLDDKYSGWDEYSKGYYNIEGRSQVSEANPMEALQVYLLSEDEEMLDKRAIPTLAAFLTRPGLHINREGSSEGSVSYWGSMTEPDTIGAPRAGWNMNSISGLYDMTGGNVPTFNQLALEKGKATVTNQYGNTPDFVNNLSMYQSTGEKSYLDAAVKQADQYLEETVYTTDGWMSRMRDWTADFIWIGYYPNIASLLDIYEVTKDKKYLDAAEYTAQMMMTALWVPGIQGDSGNQLITALGTENGISKFHNRNWIADKQYDKAVDAAAWHGDWQWRIGVGSTKPEYNVQTDAPDETVAKWIPERVGLGLEQSSTFENGSCNIIMQCWAGDFMRLAQHTGNKDYATAARNAIIGRFSNYGGYYRTDYMTFPMKADYPYTGPDHTGIYWHHIPPFLAMLEDFLFGQTMNWSNGNIEFPYARQQGYAYFNSRQFGFAPGKFFDQTDMWPWLAENTIDSGNLQIDWLAARKDGMMGIALMNESETDVTTTVSLLDGVPGGAAYSGTATVFDKDGSRTSVTVSNGKFEITVPGRTLKAVTIAIPDVKAPSFAKGVQKTATTELGGTVSNHTNGKGYTLQVNPNSYYAYVYITDKPAKVSSVELSYTVNGKTETRTSNVYPYEFIVKVNDSTQEFNYSITATTVDGTKAGYGGGTLMTRALSEQKGVKYTGAQTQAAVTTVKVDYKGSGKDFEPFKLNYTGQGYDNVKLNLFRFVVPTGNFNVSTTERELVGLPVIGTFTNMGQTIKFVSVISAIEDRGDSVVLVVPEVPGVEAVNYSAMEGSHKFDLTVYPYGTDPNSVEAGSNSKPAESTTADITYKGSGNKFDPFDLSYSRHGYNENLFRFIIPKESLKITDEKELVGLPVKGNFVLNGQNTPFESVIAAFEDRGSEVILSVPETANIKTWDYYNSEQGDGHKFELKIYPYEK